MSNSLKRDPFKSFLFEKAEYVKETGMPIIRSCNEKPNKVILFSEIFNTEDYNQWVIFYENDEKILRVWNNPRKYLEILKKFRGVITCDFSVYRNMPSPMKNFSIFMSRSLAHWWYINGIKIIPNIRFGDASTYDAAFLGIEESEVVAVGTYGNSKKKIDKYFQIKGFQTMIETIKPSTVIIYGTILPEVKALMESCNIEIINFKKQQNFFGKEKAA